MIQMDNTPSGLLYAATGRQCVRYTPDRSSNSLHVTRDACQGHRRQSHRNGGDESTAVATQPARSQGNTRNTNDHLFPALVEERRPLPNHHPTSLGWTDELF